MCQMWFWSNVVFDRWDKGNKFWVKFKYERGLGEMWFGSNVVWVMWFGRNVIGSSVLGSNVLGSYVTGSYVADPREGVKFIILN